jgi:hypothetical protein
MYFYLSNIGTTVPDDLAHTFVQQLFFYGVFLC